MAPRKKKVEVQEGEFTEVQEAPVKRTRKAPVAVEPQPEAVEVPEEENEVTIEKGILIGLTEDGRLFHKYVGVSDMQIHEAEGLREYLGRVLDNRWDEILGNRS